MDVGFQEDLIASDSSWGLVHDDVCVACGGVWEIEPHRGIMWALISDGLGISFYYIHTAVLDYLKHTHLARVEMAVRSDNKVDMRWAKMLGFKLEGFMEKYFPDGSDAFLLARVK